MSELPDGWEERLVPGPGERHYFVKPQCCGESTWTDPLRPIIEDDPLPMAWEGRCDRSMRWYYFNKHTSTITYEDPRLAESSPTERLPRGDILGDIWFYGEIPPAICVAEQPPAYSPRPDSPAAPVTPGGVPGTRNSETPPKHSPKPTNGDVAGPGTSANQLPPIQQKVPVNLDVTLPSIESLSLPRPPPHHEFDATAAAEQLLALSGSSSSTPGELNHDECPPQPESQSCNNTPTVQTPTEEVWGSGNDDLYDASDDERRLQSQIQSNGNQPVSQTDSQSNDDQSIPESEKESTKTQPTSLTDSESNHSQSTLESEKESTNIQSTSLIDSDLNDNQSITESEELNNSNPLNGQDESLATSPASKAAETGCGSILAEEVSPTQARRARREHKKQSLGKAGPEAAGTTGHSNPTPVSDLGADIELSSYSNSISASDSGADTEPCPYSNSTSASDPGSDPEPSPYSNSTPVSDPPTGAEQSTDLDLASACTPDNSLQRYKLVGAFRRPSGGVSYRVIDCNCRAEEFSPYWCRLCWDYGGLHYHALVENHPEHVQASEEKLKSCSNGFGNLVDVDYLMIEFTVENGHDGGPEVITGSAAENIGGFGDRAAVSALLQAAPHPMVGRPRAASAPIHISPIELKFEMTLDYTGVWADLYRGRTFEDAICIGRVKKMKGWEECREEAARLALEGHISGDEEAVCIRPLSMMETRISADEAGLFDQ
jgi:hypothetical protein